MKNDQIIENEILLLDKDLLFIVETFDNNIICLFLNKWKKLKKWHIFDVYIYLYEELLYLDSYFY